MENLTVVVATRNEGKVREFAAYLRRLSEDIVVKSLRSLSYDGEAVEDGKTFMENAEKKARFYAAQTNLPCLSDDSGLEVAALNNAPGVYSARYAGEKATDVENNAKLVRELRARGLTSSPAFYKCALVFCTPDGQMLRAEGACRGTIKLQARGNGGFGYDPYFYPEVSAGKSMAEISMAEKNVISHRGLALDKMVNLLLAYYK